MAKKSYALTYSKIYGYGHPDYQEDDEVKTGKITASMNGTETEIDAVNIEGHYYAGVRCLADAQKDDKLTVSWDETSKTVIINSK